MSNRLQAKSPSTPTSQPQIKPETIPGTWRHPHLDEVTRRLNKSTFNEKNFRAIVISTALLVASFSYPQFIGHFFTRNQVFRIFSDYLYYLLLFLRFFFVAKIINAVSPLAMGKDNLSDIPLSPSQRALFGLDPSATPATPATPGSTYITPPRYTRSPTPHSSDRRRSLSQVSRRDSSLGVSGSPFSPNGSPLRQQAIESNVARRMSIGSYPDYGISTSNSNFSFSRLPGTPTPTGKTGINLNSKWLYEKSRGSPILDI